MTKQKPSDKQAQQRRAQSTVCFSHGKKERERIERENRSGAANLGTDDDIRAYMRRMGYVFAAERKRKTDASAAWDDIDALERRVAELRGSS